jgi:hypothetical protein
MPYGKLPYSLTLLVLTAVQGDKKAWVNAVIKAKRALDIAEISLLLNEK